MKENNRNYDLKLFINNFKIEDGVNINDQLFKIEKILYENGIILNDISILDVYCYKDVKLTLKNVESTLGYSKEDCLNSNYVNWDAISRYSNMTEGFIRYFKERLNWTLISKRYLNNEFKFTKKFKEEFNKQLQLYKYNSNNCDVPYSNNLFGKMDNKEYSESNPTKNNNLIYPQDLYKVNLDHLKELMYSLPFIVDGGIYSDINNDNNHNEEEQKQDITKVYIDLNNYKKILIDIDDYDRNMWGFLSRKCNLSPLFIELFENKILFECLLENPNFNDMMKNDRFFDKYINKFKKIKQTQKTIREFKSKINKYNDINMSLYKGKNIPSIEL